MDYSLYYDEAGAINGQNALKEVTESLKNMVSALSLNLKAMEAGWGNSQQDFLKYKKALEECIKKYNELCVLNSSLCDFVSEYGSYIKKISSETVR